MKRTRQIIMKEIDFYLHVRDYAVCTPMIDTACHTALVDLTVEKLDRLQKEYQQYDHSFRWTEYQFARDKIT